MTIRNRLKQVSLLRAGDYPVHRAFMGKELVFGLPSSIPMRTGRIDLLGGDVNIPIPIIIESGIIELVGNEVFVGGIKIPLDPGILNLIGHDVDFNIPVLGLFKTRRYNTCGRGDRNSVITLSSDATRGGGALNNLVDGLFANNTSDSTWFNASQTDKYIRFDFGVGVAKQIRGFGVLTDTFEAFFGTVKLQGSHDEITWVDVTDPTETIIANFPVFSELPNVEFYRFWQLLMTSGTTLSSPWVQEIELFLVDRDGADNQIALAPDYANIGGTGNRSARVYIGGTMSYGGEFGRSSPFKRYLINGTTASNDIWFIANQSGVNIEFGFVADCLITEIKWYQSTTATHGTWQWQAWDRGINNWVDLGGTFTLGGATEQTITTMAGVTDYYSRYRLQQISGVTSSNPYTREIEFKIGYPEINE